LNRQLGPLRDFSPKKFFTSTRKFKEDHTVIAFCKTLYSARRAALLAMFALTLTATWTLVARAGGRDESTPPPALTPPYALFQNATITGSGNSINVTQLPVVTKNGTANMVTYDNVTIQLDVAADGTLTVSSGYPQITPAARNIVSAFRAGTYDAPASTNPITVSGPATTTGGATEWSIAAQTSSCQDVTSAAWYVGPLTSSPYYARVKAAGTPLSGFSYGVGSGSCAGGDWGNNSLMGFAQVGNQLTIFSFTVNSVDQAEPVAQVSYSKK
jgi:hypothetical protein